MPKNILFLCDDNASRSLMAEAIVNASGTRHLKAYSAGFHPASSADPDAMSIIAQAGIRARGLRPKSWREFAGEQGLHFDFAVNLGEMDRPELAELRGDDRLRHWPLSELAGGMGLSSSRKEHFLELFAEIRQLADSTLLRPANPLTTTPAGLVSHPSLPRAFEPRSAHRITGAERC